MTDIEERAYKCANENNGADNYQYFSGVEKGYIRGATDQDPISRADERKKVIDKACEEYRKLLEYLQTLSIFHNSSIIQIEVEANVERFKQAMEE